MMPARMIYPAPSGISASNTSSDARHRLASLTGRSRRSMGVILLSGVFFGAAANAATRPPAPDPVPAEPSVLEIQQGLAAGRYDAQAVEKHYERRIQSIDRSGPHLNAVIEINPDAAKIAAALRPGGTQLLFGVPVLIKDNIDTADAMQTTAGSLALVGSKQPRDAFIVSQLRKAGAVILGKTNLSE